jgi:hypothetical protein
VAPQTVQNRFEVCPHVTAVGFAVNDRIEGTVVTGATACGVVACKLLLALE